MSVFVMTQQSIGKRRRDGVVEPPDLEGLYPSEKSVKRRRVGVIQPPVLEELQLPEHFAVTSTADELGSRGTCAENLDEPAADDIPQRKASNGVHEPQGVDSAGE